jgi:hypothetical protein
MPISINLPGCQYLLGFSSNRVRDEGVETVKLSDNKSQQFLVEAPSDVGLLPATSITTRCSGK